MGVALNEITVKHNISYDPLTVTFENDAQAKHCRLKNELNLMKK